MAGEPVSIVLNTSFRPLEKRNQFKCQNVNIVRNKELTAYTGDECFLLADVVSSLGCQLVRHDDLSDVSCLTCARTLARIYGTFKKLTGQAKGGIVNRTKRISTNSPIGVSPSTKRTREHSTAHSTSANSSRSPRRSLALSGDFNRENRNPLAGVYTLEDKMESAEYPSCFNCSA